MPGTRRARPSPGAAIISSPWIVVSIGVLVMVVLMVVALGSVRGRRTFAEAPPPAPTMSLPPVPATTPSAPDATTRPPASAAGPVVPGLSPRSTVLPARPSPHPSPSAGGGSSRPAATPPAPPSVAGRYGVVSSFDGGFIGEVRLVNATGAARGWTVRLAFPQGRLVAVWVSGAEQGRGGFTDGVLTYRSGVDLAPGASVALQFHFEHTGTTRPASCTVDGAACSGL
ncbi:cellulose-binding protein [Micromonospora terminaliae]|uniref:Cellulose-binding protein n=1 Tax=Micromonospora terminaliae TaxID=1914461 RepID=A0AAJ2ZMA4_9ACTN|nr:cellulose binding domain-containing protein [Micromonospora terminaliae]NES31914.1 cellulose-binding protein [Micromonospora terminaliae]QGL48333.1 cellulose-binding protein [Micromonospora terminaliae]